MNPWFIHFYREFGEWLNEKIKPAYLTTCEECARMCMSDPERLSKEYCRKVGIKFTCSSCLFPQYHNLKCSTRGNVDKIYGYRFVPHLNKHVPIIISNTTRRMREKVKN